MHKIVIILDFLDIFTKNYCFFSNFFDIMDRTNTKNKERRQSVMAVINYIEKHLTTFSVKAHKHNYWEIIYVTDGVGTIETENNQMLEYKKGETICIPPQIRHINNSSTGFKNIHLTIEDWSPNIQYPVLIPENSASKDLLALLQLAYRYFHQFSIDHPMNFSLTAAITSLLELLLKQSENIKSTQTLLNEIINNYTDMYFDLEKAYTVLPFSQEYARKIFLKEYGVTPLQFLIQKRIELAKQLLTQKTDNNLRVNEIAKSCGFADPAYFSRIFKKETGLSPNNFQLKALTNNKDF